MKNILCFFFLLPLLPVCAQRLKPSLHLVKGETYYMASIGTSAIVQSIRGKEKKVNIKLSFITTFKVVGISDTVYNLEVNYRSVDMNIHMPDTSIEMSSAQKTSIGDKLIKPDTPSLMLAAMVNNPFNISLSATGRVLSIQNLDKVITGAINIFTQIDSVKKDKIKSRFLQSFGESAFRGSLETGTAIFPNNAVAKNDKWTVNTALTAPVKAHVKTIYQLVDIAGDFLQIHGDGSIISDEDTKLAEINGIPMKYTINGAMTTDVKIDKKTGWISQLALKQLIEGNIEIMDSPKAPGGMTIPMMFNTELSVSGDIYMPKK